MSTLNSIRLLVRLLEAEGRFFEKADETRRRIQEPRGGVALVQKKRQLVSAADSMCPLPQVVYLPRNKKRKGSRAGRRSCNGDSGIPRLAHGRGRKSFSWPLWLPLLSLVTFVNLLVAKGCRYCRCETLTLLSSVYTYIKIRIC